MSDLTLLQTIVITLALLVFGGLMVGAVAALTLLRRRRLDAAPKMTMPATTPSAVTREPDVIKPDEIDTAPLPELPPDPIPAPPVITVALPLDEPPALLIEPDDGPTQEEHNIRRLIEHLKQKSKQDAAQSARQA